MSPAESLGISPTNAPGCPALAASSAGAYNLENASGAWWFGEGIAPEALVYNAVYPGGKYTTTTYTIPQ